MADRARRHDATVFCGGDIHFIWHLRGPGAVSYTHLLLKNVDGLYTEDPRVNPAAELIEEITADELIQMDMEDMVMERKMLYLPVSYTHLL